MARHGMDRRERQKRANQLKCVAPIEPQHSTAQRTQQLQFVLILLVYYYQRRRSRD